MESYRGSPRVQGPPRKYWEHSYSSFNGVQNTVEPWLPQSWWLWPKLLLLLCTTWKRWYVWEVQGQKTKPIWITINMHCLLYTCNYYATKFNTVQPRLSELSIIQTRDAKKIQGQSTHCDHVTGLRMRSKPTSRRCHARSSCCTAIKSSFNAQRSKRNAW